MKSLLENLLFKEAKKLLWEYQSNLMEEFDCQVAISKFDEFNFLLTLTEFENNPFDYPFELNYFYKWEQGKFAPILDFKETHPSGNSGWHTDEWESIDSVRYNICKAMIYEFILKFCGVDLHESKDRYINLSAETKNLLTERLKKFGYKKHNNTTNHYLIYENQYLVLSFEYHGLLGPKLQPLQYQLDIGGI